MSYTLQPSLRGRAAPEEITFTRENLRHKDSRRIGREQGAKMSSRTLPPLPRPEPPAACMTFASRELRATSDATCPKPEPWSLCDCPVGPSSCVSQTPRRPLGVPLLSPQHLIHHQVPPSLPPRYRSAPYLTWTFTVAQPHSRSPGLQCVLPPTVRGRRLPITRLLNELLLLKTPGLSVSPNRHSPTEPKPWVTWPFPPSPLSFPASQPAVPCSQTPEGPLPSPSLFPPFPSVPLPSPLRPPPLPCVAVCFSRHLLFLSHWCFYLLSLG